MISFIVPAYNEEHELPLTLESIARAAKGSAQPYEIVVVDDASTDATAAVARAAGARVVPVTCRQIAAVRNAGARAALGEVFCFIDADTRIRPTHVRQMMDALHSGAAGGGARVKVHDPIPRWAAVSVWLFATIYFAANLGAGAFLFTSREFFERSGGFDEHYFAGEEIYFSKALKRLGKFILLAEPVATSGRKLRIYSGRDLLRQTLQILLGGRRAVGSRAKLDIWYDGRRETAVIPPLTMAARGKE